MKALKNNLNSDFNINYQKQYSPAATEMIALLQHRISALEQQIKDIKAHSKLKIITKGAVFIINFNEILYLRSNSNYTYIYFKDKKKMLVSKTLKSILEKIDDSLFMRIHASYCVNKNHIKKYIKREEKIILCNNEKLPVSRSHKKKLMKWINS